MLTVLDVLHIDVNAKKCPLCRQTLRRIFADRLEDEGEEKEATRQHKIASGVEADVHSGEIVSVGKSVDIYYRLCPEHEKELSSGKKEGK